MKKHLIFILSLFVFGLIAYSQASSNLACVGYIYVDVDLTCDKTERGYAMYPVPTPNGEEYGLYNSFSSQTYISCMEPGAPYITQFIEDQPMLHVRLWELDDMLDSDGNGFAYIEAPIRKSISNMGNPWSEQVQCYYFIILVIKKEWYH